MESYIFLFPAEGKAIKGINKCYQECEISIYFPVKIYYLLENKIQDVKDFFSPYRL